VTAPGALWHARRSVALPSDRLGRWHRAIWPGRAASAGAGRRRVRACQPGDQRGWRCGLRRCFPEWV